ncbi:NusG domain II-containing protein [Dehalobacter sp. DCM]|uniref:NusG domain II-containing protein n=1 Tax=Dehalobacter sp. DCM TaxID=2907827 RepID=UPI003081B8EC|nr:NusG domain II-containing protein [Dehalobacter sp. DCM]
MKKKGNIILIGIICTTAIIGFTGLYIWKNAHSDGHLVAVITHNEKVIERIDLNKVEQPRNITISGDYHNTIRVEKGRIRFEESDCPNKICVLTGWLKKYGDIAVCLPNKTIIEIENQ